MAIISSKDRARLAMALENQIPAVQDRALLNLFSLMLALLRDYKELEACALEQAHIASTEAANLKKLCSRLLQQA